MSIRVSIEIGSRVIVIDRDRRGDTVHYRFSPFYWAHIRENGEAAQDLFWGKFGFSFADADSIVRGEAWDLFTRFLSR